jgi:hypothetical protein
VGCGLWVVSCGRRGRRRRCRRCHGGDFLGAIQENSMGLSRAIKRLHTRPEHSRAFDHCQRILAKRPAHHTRMPARQTVTSR